MCEHCFGVATGHSLQDQRQQWVGFEMVQFVARVVMKVLEIEVA